MKAIIDIFLLIIIALCTWSGYKRGLIGGVASLLAIIIALLGGSIGAVAGMLIFHHKTNHWYFQFFMPFISLLQMAGILIWAIIKTGWL